MLDVIRKSSVFLLKTLYRKQYSKHKVKINIIYFIFKRKITENLYITRLSLISLSKRNKWYVFSPLTRIVQQNDFCYCIGKIDFYLDFIQDFSYTTRLSFFRLCIFAKQNAHVAKPLFLLYRKNRRFLRIQQG